MGIDCAGEYEDLPVSLGSWLQVGNAEIARLLARTNFEWIAIDLEHGTVFEADLPHLFDAIQTQNKLAYVRLKRPDVIEARRALDLGAGGIIVPMIEWPEQAEEIFQATLYPPRGRRGVGFSRSNHYGRDLNHQLQKQEAPAFIIQIETKNGLQNLDSILKKITVDAAMIGPYDLTASLGIPGQFDDPKYRAAQKDFVSICRINSCLPGLHVVQGDPVRLAEALEMGFRFLAFGIDTVFLQERLDSIMQDPVLQGMLGQRTEA